MGLAAAEEGTRFTERFLDRARLRALATATRKPYADARPYPHAVFDGLLGDEISEALAARFPGPDHPGWARREYREQARLNQLQRTGGRYALCTMCIGVGQGIALVLERV